MPNATPFFLGNRFPVLRDVSPEFEGEAAISIVGGRRIGLRKASADASKPVIISVFGVFGATSANKAEAIERLQIGLSALNVLVLAGYTVGADPGNPDASIGRLEVDGLKSRGRICGFN